MSLISLVEIKYKNKYFSLISRLPLNLMRTFTVCVIEEQVDKYRTVFVQAMEQVCVSLIPHKNTVLFYFVFKL